MLVTAFLIPLPLQQPRTEFDDKEAYVYGWGHCMLSAIEKMLTQSEVTLVCVHCVRIQLYRFVHGEIQFYSDWKV